MSVRLSEEDYRVNESEGFVTICVRKIGGESAGDITVTIRSRETSPPSAEGELPPTDAANSLASVSPS